jgi:hypothetical protein
MNVLVDVGRVTGNAKQGLCGEFGVIVIVFP